MVNYSAFLKSIFILLFAAKLSGQMNLFTEGNDIIEIHAYGNVGKEDMQLKINGVVACNWFSIGKQTEVLYFKANSSTTIQDVSIGFTNDGKHQGKDKNLFIDKIILNGKTYQTEAGDVETFVGGKSKGFRKSEAMPWNGYFQFGARTADPNLSNVSPTDDYPVIVYSDKNYKGKASKLQTGRHLTKFLNTGVNTISSYKVKEGYEVQFYQMETFWGNQWLTDKTGNMSAGMDNNAGSIVVRKKLSNSFSNKSFSLGKNESPCQQGTHNNSCKVYNHNSTKLKASIRNGILTARAAKCSGNYGGSGVFELRLDGPCGTVLKSGPYTKGKPESVLTLPLTTAGTYYGVLTPTGSAKNYYVGRLDITEPNVSFKLKSTVSPCSQGTHNNSCKVYNHNSTQLKASIKNGILRARAAKCSGNYGGSGVFELRLDGPCGTVLKSGPYSKGKPESVLTFSLTKSGTYYGVITPTGSLKSYYVGRLEVEQVSASDQSVNNTTQSGSSGSNFNSLSLSATCPVIIYADKNYKGKEDCLSLGKTYARDTKVGDNNIESFKIKDGYHLQLWDGGQSGKAGGGLYSKNVRNGMLNATSFMEVNKHKPEKGSDPNSRKVTIHAAGRSGKEIVRLLYWDKVDKKYKIIKEFKGVKGNYWKREFKELSGTWKSSVDINLDQIAVEFTNDSNKNDVYIDKIVFNNKEIQAEDIGTHTVAKNGDSKGFRHSEVLGINGRLEFGSQRELEESQFTDLEVRPIMMNSYAGGFLALVEVTNSGSIASNVTNIHFYQYPSDKKKVYSNAQVPSIRPGEKVRLSVAIDGGLSRSLPFYVNVIATKNRELNANNNLHIWRNFWDGRTPRYNANVASNTYTGINVNNKCGVVNAMQYGLLTYDENSITSSGFALPFDSKIQVRKGSVCGKVIYDYVGRFWTKDFRPALLQGKNGFVVIQRNGVWYVIGIINHSAGQTNKKFENPTFVEKKFIQSTHPKSNFAYVIGNKVHYDYNNDGYSDLVQAFGKGIDKEEYLFGDWNGDGTSNVAVRRGSKILMDFNYKAGVDKTYSYGKGNQEDEYLVGDWNGDGKDNVAVRRGDKIIMDYNFDGRADKTINFGINSLERPAGIVLDKYYVGDWDGDGKDNVAFSATNKYVFLEKDGKVWKTKNGNTPQEAYYIKNAHKAKEFVVGDWDGNGVDDFGFFYGLKIMYDSNGDRKTDGQIPVDVGTRLNQKDLESGKIFFGNFW